MKMKIHEHLFVKPSCLNGLLLKRSVNVPRIVLLLVGTHSNEFVNIRP